MTTFWVEANVPKEVKEDFFSALWREFLNEGLLGVEEASVQPEREVHEVANEFAAIDWSESLSVLKTKLYFSSYQAAERAILNLPKQFQTIGFVGPKGEADRDWNEEWKKNFRPIRVSPNWLICPEWEKDSVEGSREQLIILNPGAGFGTGTHETTQLCLSIMDFPRVRGLIRGARVLDFGAGSGILSIGASKLGALEITAIEIDESARKNALGNVALNGCEEKIRVMSHFGSDEDRYDVMMANILRPVLLEFAEELIRRWESEQGVLILSGLLESDVAPVVQCYENLMVQNGIEKRFSIFELGEWRALLWV